MDSSQLMFNFNEDVLEVEDKCVTSPLSEHLIKVAVMKWLEETDAPDSVALNVPTRLKKYYSDIAASWSSGRRNSRPGGVYKLLHPVKTAIAECRTSVDACWPDAGRSAALFEKMAQLKEELERVKTEIKLQEPHLKTDGNLFDEYAEWDFGTTANQRYHTLLKAIEEISDSVYNGTYFERLHQAQLADFMYLAVPKGVLKPSEVAEGWGLLYVGDDLRVEVVVEPVEQCCSEEGRQHLVQNIAAAAKQAVLFSQGILSKQDGVKLLKKPKRRRKALEI